MLKRRRTQPADAPLGAGLVETQRIEPFRAVLQGRELVVDPTGNAELPMDPDGLARALAEGPALISFWIALEADAEAQVERAERDLALRAAQLHVEVVQRGGEKKAMTLDAIRAVILQSPDYRAKQDAVTQAKRQYGYIRAGRRGAEKRHDSAVALVQKYRTEFSATHYDPAALSRAAREQLSAIYKPGA